MDTLRIFSNFDGEYFPPPCDASDLVRHEHIYKLLSIGMLRFCFITWHAHCTLNNLLKR